MRLAHAYATTLLYAATVMTAGASSTLSNATGSSLANVTCADLEAAEKERVRAELLQSALTAARQYEGLTRTVSFTSIGFEVIFLLLFVLLRRHRKIQYAGVSCVGCLLFGCIFGHLASLMDGVSLSGTVCRGKLALIYLFIICLIAPLFGKLVSLCRAAHNVVLAGNLTGWDGYAQRIMYTLVALQLVMLIFYLGITVNKPTREDRLQTVCSDQINEHVFHVINGLFTAGLLVAIFCMVAWLQISSLTRDTNPENRGTRDLLLSAINISIGSIGLLLLLATSTQDLSLASAVVPVRLMIIVVLSWFNIGLQVFPPLFLTVRDYAKRMLSGRVGRARIKHLSEEATMRMVAVQKKQLLQLEAEVVERQRALQELTLRLKLMTQPILQMWAEVRVLPNEGGRRGHGTAQTASPRARCGSTLPPEVGLPVAEGGASGGLPTVYVAHDEGGEDGGDGGRSGGAHRQTNFGKNVALGSTWVKRPPKWQWYYVRLFQNKKLVCWTDDSEQCRQLTPAKVIDLFEVRDVQNPCEEFDTFGAPVAERRLIEEQLQLCMKNDLLQIRNLGNKREGGLTERATTFVTGNSVNRQVQRAKVWLSALQDMLREITEPDPPPSFQTVKIWVGTWNMGNAAPDIEQLRALLEVDGERYDLYALGLQESTFPLSKEQKQFGTLNAYMSTLVQEVLGNDYKVVETKAMWEIRLFMIAHEDVLPHLEVLDAASEATGIGGVGGNKGGVAVAISLHKTSFCFVTAHLAAHQHMTNRRNRDCFDIFRGMRSLASAKRPGKRSLDPSIGFDHTFFFGDLNYRIGQPLEFVLDVLDDAQKEPVHAQRAWSRLHPFDQLRDEQMHGRALSPFTEQPPNFAPTFKKFKSGKGACSATRVSAADVDKAEGSAGEVGRTDRRGSVPRSVLKGFPMAGSKSAVALASGIATASAGIATASAAATASALKSASDYVPVPRRIGRGVFGGSDETIEEDEGEELDEATINRSELAGGRFVGGRFATTPPPGSAEFKRKSSGMASEKTMSASEGDMSGKLSEKTSDVAGSSVEGGSSSLEGVEEALEEERSTSQVDDESLDAATVVSERASRLGYNPSRIPSWCDRVLWRSYPMCVCEQTGYHAVTAVDTSDHTPVCATFAVQVMLPSDAESHGTGDLYQWELSIASVAIAIPLSALDDDDAMAAKVHAPELSVEFFGNTIRTGYSTPQLEAKLEAVGSGGAERLGAKFSESEMALTAKFGHTIDIPMTDLAQRIGAQSLAVSHLVMQVVAAFGHRRVVIGASVLPMNNALNEPGITRHLDLVNCGVQGGGMLSIEPTLRDSGSRAQLFGTHGARRSIDKATRRSVEKRERAATRMRDSRLPASKHLTLPDGADPSVSQKPPGVSRLGSSLGMAVGNAWQTSKNKLKAVTAVTLLGEATDSARHSHKSGRASARGSVRLPDAENAQGNRSATPSVQGRDIPSISEVGPELSDDAVGRNTAPSDASVAHTRGSWGVTPFPTAPSLPTSGRSGRLGRLFTSSV